MITTSLRAPIASATSARETPREVSAAAQKLAARVPFRSPDSQLGSASAQLQGKLPEWLRGDLLRVAPAFGAAPNWAPAHWFDALGLAFGVALDGGEQVRLRWAGLECQAATAAASGKVELAQFASPNQRSALTRLLQPIPALTDNANVNVQRMGDDLVAMTETPHQLLLDPISLRVRGRVQYDDKLGNRAMLAHPIIQADKVTNLGFTFNPLSEVALYEHRAASRTRTVRAKWRTTELPYLHSFGLTERTGILIDHPLRLRAHRLLWSNEGVISAFRWQPSTGTRLVLMDLHGGGTRVHETDTLFCFHTVHAFETPDATVLDLIAYPDASVVTHFSLPSFADGFPAAQSKLTRLTVDRRTGAVTRRTLCDLAFELPQVDWDFVGTGEERYVYGSALRSEADALRSEIVRVDVQSGASQRFAEADHVCCEPVFVGAPGRTREGDGVLLTVGSSARGSSLFVLDATTLNVLARAEFEVPLPLGFHGSFTPAARA